MLFTAIEGQVINEGTVMDLENCHFATGTAIINSGNTCQWQLKISG